MAYRGTVILRYVGNRSTPEPLPTPIYNVPPIPLPDWSIGDVIGAWMDGTIVLDDGLTTWNPERAREFLEKL